PMRLRLPVEHRHDGSLRWVEEKHHLRPTHAEHRLELAMEWSLPSQWSCTTMIAYRHHPHHTSSSPHIACAFMIKKG
ncbi:MAG: hypothetical protein LBD66_01420, partial [Holosporales bacterium]|nr:hypothetical protein [Holosporales bacterium]